MVEIIQAMLNSLAISFDIPILNWIQTNLIANFMDNFSFVTFMDSFWYTITLFGEGGVFWIVCAVALLLYPKTRKIGLGMAFALVMGLLVCNIWLKPMIARVRPYEFALEHFGTEVWLLTGPLSDFSFPSGHTIASFEASVVLLKNSKKLGIPALILAILVSFSRLYLYVHYPSDVIFSVVFGTIFALIGNALAGLIIHTPQNSGKYQGKFLHS